MTPATLLFYAVASLCLGSLSVPVGPTMVAQVFGKPELVPVLTAVWSVATLAVAAVFLLWAIFAAIGSGEPFRGEEDRPA